MTTPIPSARPWFPTEEIEWILGEIRAALESGALTRGPHVARFEQEFAAAVGVHHAVAVSSGTAALEIVLRHMLKKAEDRGLKSTVGRAKGEKRRAKPEGLVYLQPTAYSLQSGARGGLPEVIVPTNTFLATANAVIFAGGRPVLVDIEADSLCIDPEAVRAAIGPRTRGVIAVHIAGRVCPALAALRDLCRARGLFLIEDAAHAHGATMKQDGVERAAGSLADAAAFSFFPSKPMTTGEGGMITADDDALAEFARAWRNHGVFDRPQGGKPFHEALGHNLRLSELGAVLGRSQLRSLEPSLVRRRAVAARYREGLARLPVLQIPSLPEDGGHGWYKFPVLLLTGELRSALAAALLSRHGIQTGAVYWPPCHRQPVVEKRPDLYEARGPFPVADDVLDRVLCLPMHARLTPDDVDRVIEAVRRECNAKVRKRLKTAG